MATWGKYGKMGHGYGKNGAKLGKKKRSQKTEGEVKGKGKGGVNEEKVESI